MAPEILLGKKYDLKADLWSMGVMTYLFLTGRFPFEATSPQKLLLAFGHGIVKFPHDLVITESCYGILKNLLQIDPNQRMEWKDYFKHPFIAYPPEKYDEILISAPKHDTMEWINSSITFLII